MVPCRAHTNAHSTYTGRPSCSFCFHFTSPFFLSLAFSLFSNLSSHVHPSFPSFSLLSHSSPLPRLFCYPRHSMSLSLLPIPLSLLSPISLLSPVLFLFSVLTYPALSRLLSHPHHSTQRHPTHTPASRPSITHSRSGHRSSLHSGGAHTLRPIRSAGQPNSSKQQPITERSCRQVIGARAVQGVCGDQGCVPCRPCFEVFLSPHRCISSLLSRTWLEYRVGGAFVAGRQTVRVHHSVYTQSFLLLFCIFFCCYCYKADEITLNQ